MWFQTCWNPVPLFANTVRTVSIILRTVKFLCVIYAEMYVKATPAFRESEGVNIYLILFSDGARSPCRPRCTGFLRQTRPALLPAPPWLSWLHRRLAHLRLWTEPKESKVWNWSLLGVRGLTETLLYWFKADKRTGMPLGDDGWNGLRYGWHELQSPFHPQLSIVQQVWLSTGTTTEWPARLEGFIRAPSLGRL